MYLATPEGSDTLDAHSSLRGRSSSSPTVKPTPLLATPPTVTTTAPVLAPSGTGATIEVSLQLSGSASVPANSTVLVPSLAPKFVPLISTLVPTAPEAGLSPLIAGAGTVTVKPTPLLATPSTVTTTAPVLAPSGTRAVIRVSLQLEGSASVPANSTVLVPSLPPKFAPLISTLVPTGPEAGFSPLISGAAGAPVSLSSSVTRQLPGR